MATRDHETSVALTDFAVGIEAAVFAVVVARRGSHAVLLRQASDHRRWFAVFFSATSVAAFAGAAVHGLFPAEGAPWRRRLWRVSLGSIGVAGLSAWSLGAALALEARTADRVRRLAIVTHVAYLAALVRLHPPYIVAIASYLPGALFLGAGLMSRLGDRLVRRPATIALAGLALTFGAAIVQVRRIAVHRRLFDHNATYHTIQALATGCFFWAARGLIPGDATPEADPTQVGGRR